jgi:ribonucleotide monophosphatase NagD (HAD superfamily)
MVGDNPASDITGANRYKSSRGTEWVSVLVRTGVYRDGDYDGGAKKIADNVEEAVRWAVEREEWEAQAQKNS